MICATGECKIGSLGEAEAGMSSEWPALSKTVENVLVEARLHAGQGLAEAVGIEHLLLAMLTSEEAIELEEFGLSAQEAQCLHDGLLARSGLTLLRRLLSIYVKRLLERDIRFEYDPGVLIWLLEQPGWKESVNPLGTLKRFSETQVANKLEELLLSRKVRSKCEVTVQVVNLGGAASLEFFVRD
jgi:ATP-dependent Clp protease ATP-binding subunit ClpA